MIADPDPDIDRVRDRGAILVLVLVLCIVLGGATAAIANYTATSLRASRTTQDRSQRLTATDGALRSGVELLRASPSSCPTSTWTSIPVPTVNSTRGTSLELKCRRTAEFAGFVLEATATSVRGGSTKGTASLQLTDAGGYPCTAGSCRSTILQWTVGS